MKKQLAPWLVLAAMAVLMLFFSNHVNTRLNERSAVVETRARLEAEAKRVSAERVDSVLTKLGKITHLENLEEFAAKDMAPLSKGERTLLGPRLRAKLFEAYFRRAELLLGRAGDLLREDENHPTGKEYIERAGKIYAGMNKLIDAGVPARSGDLQENARLNYMKGAYYYRSLFFVKDVKAEAERVKELIGLALKHYSAVFQYKPRDRDTEVAIELLQKTAQKMGAGGDGESGKLRLELLPSRGNNQGPTFAIEGSGEGRN